mmetsp:Transcript_16067/g.36312  ORF Transcript_16067/g.36312 Transcript_16067/m.36312 type:complete len:336 (-) Transcript_16067:94-1101(-)
MAKLFTHHDMLHVHACLGLLALLHFAYRFGALFVFGGDGGNTFKPGVISMAALAIHFFLHITSFQFALPRARNFHKPMLWPEFRVHNALFTYRSLLGCVLGMYFPSWWCYEASLSSTLVKVGIVFFTSAAADFTTAKLGSTDERTTNAMPYPSGTPANVEVMVKYFYAKAQVIATALSVFGTPVLSFGPMLAIEIAPLLMTLVRKGLIEAKHYHIVYSAALFVNFPAMVLVLLSGDRSVELATFRVFLASAIVVELRMKFAVPKYVTWVVTILGTPLIATTLSSWVDVRWLVLLGSLWSVAGTLRKLVNTGKAGTQSSESGPSAVEKDIGPGIGG